MSKNSVAFEETEDNNFFVHFWTKKTLCAMSRDVVEGQPRKEILLRILT